MRNIRIACAAAVLFAALFSIAGHACRSSGAHASPHGLALHDQVGDGVEDALARIREKLADPSNSVVDPDHLIEDVRATLRALLSGDADTYYTFRTSHGAVFIRSFAEGLVNQWNDRKIIDTRPSIGLSDMELFKVLWDTNPQRRMAILFIRADQTLAGRGATIRFGTPEADWPTRAVQFSSSLFSPAAGRFSQEQGAALDGTPRSAHVTVTARLVDGTTGYVRFNYLFDDQQNRWFPATIAAASEDSEYWPWPLF